MICAARRYQFPGPADPTPVATAAQAPTPRTGNWRQTQPMAQIASPASPAEPLNPPQRVLLGPGPSDVPPRVLQAMAAPTLGHLDPLYLRIMDETRRMLREVFRTRNELTMAISGTGSAGMEAAVVNLVEPGDEMIVCVNGVFGGRMRDVAQRAGTTVHSVEAEWGRTIEPDAVAQALKAHPKTKVVG